MKTTKLLTAVSAAALLGVSSVALAQGTGGGTGSQSAPPASTLQKQPDAPPAGSTSGQSGSMSKDSMSKDSMSKDGLKSKQAQDKDGLKSNQAQQGKDPLKAQAQDKSPPAAGTKSQMSQDKDADKSGTKSQMSQDKDAVKSGTKSQMSQDKDATKSETTVGAAGSGAVNLTTEQRTTIRQTVLTSNAPRATNINFSINVGTVVPSSVRVVAVPDTIVRINPRWKGYRYFVYNDEIIIVEPRTLKIVAVLDV